MCDQEGHSADECPWVYTSCKEPNCDGIRKITKSNTSSNPGRKFLACQYGSCTNGWKWLDEELKLALEPKNIAQNQCYRCNEIGHWMKECPWIGLKCRVCSSNRVLKTSGKSTSKGDKYLKCYNCQDFQWLKDAQNAKRKEDIMQQQGVEPTVTINMSLAQFCSQFNSATITVKRE